MVRPRGKLPSLDALQRKIDRAKQGERPHGQRAGRDYRGASVAVRLMVELASGIVVGVGLGYALDRWLDTSPWLLIVCMVLGSAAGFLNLMRAARQEEQRTARQTGNDMETKES